MPGRCASQRRVAKDGLHAQGERDAPDPRAAMADPDDADGLAPKLAIDPVTTPKLEHRRRDILRDGLGVRPSGRCERDSVGGEVVGYYIVGACACRANESDF